MRGIAKMVFEYLVSILNIGIDKRRVLRCKNNLEV
jgi:hypothetical protein